MKKIEKGARKHGETIMPLRDLFKNFLIFTTILLATVAAHAQQIGNPATEQGVNYPRGVFAIRNAHIVTLAGPDIEDGTVVIRDGKIEAVGASVSVPAGAQSIEGRGL